MSKYINKKQLFFMVFIIIAFYVGKIIRQERTSEKTDFTVNNKTFRSQDNQMSNLVICQMKCLGVGDSAIQSTIINGTAIQFDSIKKYFVVEGRTFDNIPLRIYGHWEKQYNLIDSLKIENSNICKCL